MNIRRLADLDVAGKRVLLRLDLNVPLKGKKVTDTTRVDLALPTIRALREAGARLVICSHLGRPKGQRVPGLSLEPVAALLAERLDAEVYFAHDTVGDDVRYLSRELPEDGLMVLENLRFHPGEQANDPDFAAQLARLGDVYVNDAFGAMHREHASVCQVVENFANVGIGLLVERELEALSKLFTGPERPFVGILGGAKVSDKIGVIESLLTRVDALVIGGAMAYTFLAAKELPVGDSLVEADKVKLARRLMERAQARGVSIFLPVDHVVATDADAAPETVKSIPDGTKGFDIGPDSVALFGDVIGRSGTVFWNGPMGLFENPAFSAGTRGVAEAVAAAEAFTVVGGGDSAAAINSFGLADKVSHISTGGGASLAYIQGQKLPALAALEAKAKR